MDAFATSTKSTHDEAPDQNRTDTRSLEGYCSTIELQAHKNEHFYPEKRFKARRSAESPYREKNILLIPIDEPGDRSAKNKLVSQENQ